MIIVVKIKNSVMQQNSKKQVSQYKYVEKNGKK